VGRVLRTRDVRSGQKRIKQESPPFSCFSFLKSLILSTTGPSRQRLPNSVPITSHRPLSNMLSKTTPPAVRSVQHTQHSDSVSSSSSSSTGPASPRSAYSPTGSPQMVYFEEPLNEPYSPTERQSKWGRIAPIRTSSKSPRPSKHRSSSSTDETAMRTPSSPNTKSRSRHSGTFSDVGRHGNDWLFGGYGPRDVARGVVGSLRSSTK
jgi:hypothetical protein